MNSFPKISVVTIVYNDKNHIAETICSVLAQTYTNVEYIIVDGLSTDGTVEIIDKYSSQISKIISEKDEGIYDAMNKGIKNATGDYIIFMNSGDAFTSNQVLNDLFYIKKINADFIYGDAQIKELDGALRYKSARSHTYSWYGMFTNHQSMIYNLEIIRKYNIIYDTAYSIAADYKFTLEFLNYAADIIYVNLPVSIFSLGGLSSTQTKKGLLESEKVRLDVRGYNKIQNLSIRILTIFSHFLNNKLSKVYKFLRYS
jgi:putative colanic acid biosynthesis glycosyltransferase